MEIQILFYIFSVNCFLIPSLESKTFSLNEAIAAEAQLKGIVNSTVAPAWSKLTERAPAWSKFTESNKATSTAATTKSPHSPKHRLLSKLNESKNKKRVALRETPKLLAPLAYKNKFKISSPLRPKKLKVGQNLRFKRKNTATKREIKNIGNEKLREKYIPLLKSLGMLFDNLLDSDADRSNEIKTKKHKRNRFYSPELFDIPCNCTNNSDTGYTEYDKDKKTTSIATSFSKKIPAKVFNFTVAETTPTPTNTIATRNFGAFRQHKNIPLLFSRNTTSSRRTNTGNSKGSSAALHRDIQRNISRDNGSNEPNTRKEKYYSSTNNDEKYTFSDTREHTSGPGHTGTVGDGNIVRTTKSGDSQAKNNESKIKTADDSIGKNQFEARRIEKEIPKFLSKPFGGIRRTVRNDKVKHSKPLQPEEIREEGDDVVAHNVTSHPRLIVGDGTAPTEVQEVRARNETITIGNQTISLDKPTITINNVTTERTQGKKKSPVVMIFDGYSVTRHKNGENKLSEKSIRIHS